MKWSEGYIKSATMMAGIKQDLDIGKTLPNLQSFGPAVDQAEILHKQIKEKYQVMEKAAKDYNELVAKWAGLKSGLESVATAHDNGVKKYKDAGRKVGGTLFPAAYNGLEVGIKYITDKIRKISDWKKQDLQPMPASAKG